MSYDSLTLKYRPTRLEHLVGQASVVDTIRGMLESHEIGRSILLSGPWGVGKTTAARILAMSLNCTGGEAREISDPPCGECQSCRRIRKGHNTQDYIEINASDFRGIDMIRGIREQAQYKPVGLYRIFVLDEVHQITGEAANAFLKILEEPPPDTIFILCTTNPYKLEKTIISRCKKLDMGLVQAEKIAKSLRRIVKGEELDLEIFTDELLGKIAALGDGHPRDAISILEAVINRFKGSKEPPADLDAFVIAIADDLVESTPEAIVSKFLMGVYGGKFTGALLALREVGNHQRFIDTVLDFHTHTMFWRFSPKLQDKMMFAWYTRLEEKFEKNTLDPVALVKIMELFNETASEFKGFSANGYYTLVNMAVKAVLACKGTDDSKD